MTEAPTRTSHPGEVESPADKFCPVQVETRFFKELIPAAGINSEVILNLIRCADFLSNQVADNLRRQGLGMSQLDVLVVLEAVPDGLTMVEIARRMLVSRAGVTGLVKAMQREGWVERREVKNDARAVCIRLTAQGQSKLDAVLPSHLATVQTAVGEALSTTEKQDLVATLTRLRGHLATLRSERATR